MFDVYIVWALIYMHSGAQLSKLRASNFQIPYQHSMVTNYLELKLFSVITVQTEHSV